MPTQIRQISKQRGVSESSSETINNVSKLNITPRLNEQVSVSWFQHEVFKLKEGVIPDGGILGGGIEKDK